MKNAMKKFSFRLEKLLALKERIEALKRGEYGAAMQRVAEREKAIMALHAERTTTSADERCHLTGDNLNVARLQMYSRYFHHLRGQLLLSHEVKRSLEKKAEDKREEMVESSREKRTLERYKEKLRLRHIQELEKAEQAELDELGATQFVRHTRQEDSHED